MTRWIPALLIACSCASTVAQIQVGVRTDRYAYQYGDTVDITVTAFNPSADSLRLLFPSSCQASYSIDTFALMTHIYCLTIPTSRWIPPHDSVKWEHFQYPARGSGFPRLSVGSHAVVGEVLGYAKSPAIQITIVAPTTVKEDGRAARGFVLGESYPNPFNASTVVSYQLPVASGVRLIVYDLIGRRVATLANENKAAGKHSVQFDGSAVASGVYLCRMEAGSFVDVKKLVVLK